MAITPKDLNALYKEKLLEVAQSEKNFKEFIAFVGKSNLKKAHEQFMCFIQKPETRNCVIYKKNEKEYGIYIKKGSKGIGYLNFQDDEPTKYYFDINDVSIPKELGNYYGIMNPPKDPRFISYLVQDFKDNGVDDEKKLFNYLQKYLHEKAPQPAVPERQAERAFIEYYVIYAVFSSMDMDLELCESMLKEVYPDFDFSSIIGEVNFDSPIRDVYPMYNVARDIGSIAHGIREHLYEKHLAFTEKIKNNEPLAEAVEEAKTEDSLPPHWRIEFNEMESSEYINIRDYTGEILDAKLLLELEQLDLDVKVHNQEKGLDYYERTTEEYLGYLKFFLEYVVDGKPIDKLRIDIGDGPHFNQLYFGILRDSLGIHREKTNDIELEEAISYYTKNKLGQSSIEHQEEYQGAVDSFVSTLERDPEQSDYWVVEYNEKVSTGDSSLVNYRGLTLHKELLEEIKALDQDFCSNYKGYAKFYIDHIIGGEVEEHIRIDIGNGNEHNREIFQKIEKSIEPVQSSDTMIHTNMGTMPLQDYQDILLWQYGFNSVEELKKHLAYEEEMDRQLEEERKNASYEEDENILLSWTVNDVWENPENEEEVLTGDYIFETIDEDYLIHLEELDRKLRKDNQEILDLRSASGLGGAVRRLFADTKKITSFSLDIHYGVPNKRLAHEELRIGDVAFSNTVQFALLRETLGMPYEPLTKEEQDLFDSKLAKIREQESIKAEGIKEDIEHLLDESIQAKEDETQINLEPIVERAEEIESTSERIVLEVQKEPKNFVITKEVQAEKLAPSVRLNQNLEAISMLKRVESGKRELDTSAQEVLARYVGWGGLSEVFADPVKGQWKVAQTFLQEHLSKEEYAAAKESTLTAFYTPKVVIDGIYKTLSDMGFQKGNILEPSMGIGNFVGNLPETMQQSKVYGVELDSISGRIAKLLYPESDIQIKGFEESEFSNNFFDVAIGNVPFGDFQVHDREYDKNKFLIHDYFFAKSIDKVRSGGTIAFVTSSGTMDKKDESIRRYINARAEFLGAIRLPNDTFKGLAGTEVTSDVIFLKKRDRIVELDADWIHLAEDKNGLSYNQYFVNHPSQVLGEMREVSGRFGNTLTCEPTLHQEEMDSHSFLQQRFAQAAERISHYTRYEALSPIQKVPGQKETLAATADVKNFSYTIIEDQVYYRENSILVPQTVTKKDKERIQAYISLSKALRELIHYQMENSTDETIKEAQEALERAYDAYTSKYQFLNATNNARFFKEDSNYPLLSSIEKLDKDGQFESKGDIFYKRTISKAVPVDRVDTPLEALVLSISQQGKVDFDYMAALTGNSRESLVSSLQGEIFLDIPSTIPREDYIFSQSKEEDSYQYVSRDEYLSGNIRNKIAVADQYLKLINKKQEVLFNQDPALDAILSYEIESIEYQKSELIKALPKQLEASEIQVRLGATWIPRSVVRQFVIELLKTPVYARWDMEVQYDSFTSAWKITNKTADRGNTLAELTYGTSRISAYHIIEDTLNLKEVKVNDPVINADGKTEYVLNKKETLLAGQKQELIREEFKSWIFKDPIRRKELVQLYNERFNSVRNREYDGSHLSFDGMNPGIHLLPHQKNAIARSLYGGNSLFAHVVGAGKTFEMVASIMEAKRLGLCNKALLVVPNHLTEQMGREFMQLYPAANILVTDKKDFEKRNRKRLTAKIATGEYDAIIIGHTQFEKIPMSKEYQKNHIDAQIEETVQFISQYKYQRNQEFTVKQLEKVKKELETKLKKLNDEFKKDDVLTFEELGVDKLIVDEAHGYKNLHLKTKMGNVAGIGQTEAKKSSDMFMKCRYMDEITDGKGIIFATGTPISNSMTELYTMQRYLQYRTLEENDLIHFDAWASTFGETSTAFELSPEGTGYRMKTRFSKFYNLPELMSYFKEIADIQTADMLDLPTPEAHFEVIKTEPSQEQKEILKGLSERAERVRNKSVAPEEDNMLKITNDGKKLALDQRLINPLLPDNAASKVNVCIRETYRVWSETMDQRSTQLIFSDLSTPKEDGSFNIYDDIRNKLISMGIPKNEIVFIHEATTEEEKERLFERVRRGDVRILLGSTGKMGAGTNVQDKLIAIHDLDVPWRPADLEQRAGRIVRRGNENQEVYIYRYITENTFDSYLWQTIENKQKFISQIMTSKSSARVAEDVDKSTLSYAEIKALAMGDSRIKEKMDLEAQVAKLKLLEAEYNSNRYKLEDRLSKGYPNEIEKTKERIVAIETDLQRVEAKPEQTDVFPSFILDGKQIYDKKKAGELLLETLQKGKFYKPQVIGNYRNLDLEVQYNTIFNTYEFYLRGNAVYQGEFGTSADGNLTRLDNVIAKMPEQLQKANEKLLSLEQQIENVKLELSKPFEKAVELREKTLRLAEINQALELGDMEEDVLDKEQAPIEDVDIEVDIVTEEIDRQLEEERESRLMHIENAVYMAKFSSSVINLDQEFSNIFEAYTVIQKDTEGKLTIYQDGVEIDKETLYDLTKELYQEKYGHPIVSIKSSQEELLQSGDVYNLQEMDAILAGYTKAYAAYKDYNAASPIQNMQVQPYKTIECSLLSMVDDTLVSYQVKYRMGADGVLNLKDSLNRAASFQTPLYDISKSSTYPEGIQKGVDLQSRVVVESLLPYLSEWSDEDLLQKKRAYQEAYLQCHIKDLVPPSFLSQLFYIKDRSQETSSDMILSSMYDILKSVRIQELSENASIYLRDLHQDIEFVRLSESGKLLMTINLQDAPAGIRSQAEYRELAKRVVEEYPQIQMEDPKEEFTSFAIDNRLLSDLEYSEEYEEEMEL